MMMLFRDFFDDVTKDAITTNSAPVAKESADANLGVNDGNDDNPTA